MQWGSLSITRLPRANIVSPISNIWQRAGEAVLRRYLCSTVQRGQVGEQEAQEETWWKEDRMGARLEELVGGGARCDLFPRTLGATRGVQLGCPMG